jgi:uncharacterized protein (TIGR00266 family)
MRDTIIGNVMPVLEITLDTNERVIAVSGELAWMTPSIHMATTATGGGGLFGAFKRIAGGASLFMTEYTAQGAPGTVAFCSKAPGHIVPLDLDGSMEYMVHRHGFIASTTGIEVGVGFQRSLGAGIFGGDGFTLQKLSGQGRAWMEVGGELISYNLQAGQNLRVHPGHVGAFAATVRFDITTVSGISNVLFGGDGLFLASLTGPGQIWLQSFTMSNLAHALIPYLPAKG